MKRTLPYHILLAFGLLFTAGCEKEEIEEEIYPLQVFATGPGNGRESWGAEYYKDGEITNLMSNAKVYLYGSEEDYLLQQNPLHEGLTDEKGMFYKEFNEPYAFWVYVEKGKLNNNRYAFISSQNISGCNNRNHNYAAKDKKIYKEEQLPMSKGETFMMGSASLFPVLSPDPAKLSLTIFHNGEPIEGAKVTLYLSKGAYEQGLPAYFEIEELKTSYGIYDLASLKSDLHPCLEKTFVQTSDGEGQVFFQNLEPRQYWFKVEKEGKTNAGGMIDTAKPLSEDPNITTSLTVGIN